MNIVVILALCLATYVAEAESHAIDSECRLPVTNKIDFAQLREKNWYITSHNEYSLLRTDVCVVISDVEETNGGLDFQYKMFNNSGVVDHITIHTTLQPSGKYTWKPTSELKGFGFVHTTETGPDSFSPTDAGNEMEKERDHLRWISDYKKPHAYLTDYKTYLFELKCDTKGKQSVWIHTSTQYPTTDDIIRIHNRLLDIGFRWDDIYLVVSSCAVMKPSNFNSK
uniref:uncharacterized protein LOC120339979 isoform X2 n=1 Tax=Styela clava TaxID=7725 RepID=UPI0019392FEC|nr:uncharacterized protein LOC120339979 isoform X2 [Styela clava]